LIGKADVKLKTSTDAWEEIVSRELGLAETARSAGNEGMARVCARRAAGAIIAEYLRREGLPQSNASAFDLLRYMGSQPGMTARTLEVVGHFLVRITPEHELPIEADLIADARWLADELLSN
jgi:hypothetical protein